MIEEKILFNKFGTQLISEFNELENISEKYKVELSEILQIDINRCGIYLRDGEVKEDFRVRFKIQINNDFETWCAIPVRNKKDTPYNITNGKIFFNDTEIGTAKELCLDTCDTSYQRGPTLLNLNSRSRSSCGGCKACIHNYHKLYDKTVIKDRVSLDDRDSIEDYFDKMNFEIDKFDQIAVVTGLFKNEEHVVEHMKLISNIAKDRGFDGEIMYFGCQVNSDKALFELSKINNFYLIYALDNFNKRNVLLSKVKSAITVESAKDTLLRAKKLGIKTTISYISGLDNLEESLEGFKYLKESFTNFPIINVYQMQTVDQSQILNEKAKKLEFYVETRLGIEKIFNDTDLRPKRWENYRPLWYKYFASEEFKNNSYGQLEKNGRNVKW